MTSVLAWRVIRSEPSTRPSRSIDLARYLLGGDLKLIDKHISRFAVDLGLTEWQRGRLIVLAPPYRQRLCAK
jgi:hypothetical protein